MRIHEHAKIPGMGLDGLRGTSLRSLKKHYGIVPIYVAAILGITLGGGALFRTATKSPEVYWARKSNPEPYEEYRQKQSKLWSAGRDYSLPNPAPTYK